MFVQVSSPRIPGTRLLVRLQDGLHRPIGVAADSSYVYIGNDESSFNYSSKAILNQALICFFFFHSAIV